MSLYEKIMECEKKGIGKKLDDRLNTKTVSPAFYKKHGMSAHTVWALLFAGELKGFNQMRMAEIDRYINEVAGTVFRNGYFCNSRLPLIKKYYKIKEFPNEVDTKASFKPERMTCINCCHSFKTRPENLCICKECAPNGVMYDSNSSHGKYSNSFTSKTLRN